MAGERRTKQELLITVCAVLFILTGARAANQPAVPLPGASCPAGITVAFKAWNEPPANRPLPLLWHVMRHGWGGIVHIGHRGRGTVAVFAVIICPGLPGIRGCRDGR